MDSTTLEADLWLPEEWRLQVAGTILTAGLTTNGSKATGTVMEILSPGHTVTYISGHPKESEGMGPVLEFLLPSSTVITISGPLIETPTTVSEAAMQPSPASRVHLFP